MLRMNNPILVPLAEAFLRPAIGEDIIPGKLIERSLRPVSDRRNLWLADYRLNMTKQFIQLSFFKNTHGLVLPCHAVVPENPEEAEKGLTSWFAMASIASDRPPVIALDDLKRRSRDVITGMSDSVFDVVHWPF